MDDPAEMYTLRPIQIGRMQLDHRLVVPSHVTGNNRLVGSDEEFEQHCAYWVARVKGGVQWIGGDPVSVRIPLSQRLLFADRLGRYVDRVHAANGFATVRLVADGDIELDELVREYSSTAALAVEAGADAIELDGDNGRSREVVDNIRAAADRPITIGLRLRLDAVVEGTDALDDFHRSINALRAAGTIDYVSLDVGDNTGAEGQFRYGDAERIELCGRIKQSTHLPVLFVGRVLDLAAAERILADGHADLIGITRATIADPEVVAKTRNNELELVRPCVGVDDCIDRRVVAGVGFACAANPHVGNELIARLPPVKRSQRVLVIGGGPAGMEFAALATQRGHRVTLWERESELGGQLAVAAKARINSRFADWIRWQQSRLQRLAITVELCHQATLDDIGIVDPNLVVVATGAVPHAPDIPGIDSANVHQATDVLMGRTELGPHVVVVSDGDNAPAFAVADHLLGLGHRVTIASIANGLSAATDAHSSALGLARLDGEGSSFEPMARLTGIESGRVHLEHTFSNRCWTIEGVDSVVLAGRSVPDNALYLSLRGTRPNVHILGDAVATRRMIFATRQAWQLASLLD